MVNQSYPPEIQLNKANTTDTEAPIFGFTAKPLQQNYRFHKLRKTFSKFYRRHYELISKFNVGLKTLFLIAPFPDLCLLYPLYPTFTQKSWSFQEYAYFFLIFAPKHRLWVVVKTASARRFEHVPTIDVLSKYIENIKFLPLDEGNE